MHNANSDQSIWIGVRRGLGLGLVFTLVEVLGNVPVFIHFRHHQPLAESLIIVGFNLALGVILGLLTVPLLKLKRGRLGHTIGVLALLAILVLALPPQFEFRRSFDAMMLVAVGLLYPLGLWLARRVLRAGISVFAGVLVVFVGFGLPGWLTAMEAELGGERASAPDGAPNVLLIVLDTVRSDRLDLMGYHRQTLPWLKTFAREGSTFRRALAAGSWTVPSHASMFTGLYPSAHGAHNERTYLHESHTTLAEILCRHGWETVALSANPWVSRSSGLAQGFATADPLWFSANALNFSFAYRIGWKLGLVGQDHNGRRVTDEWLRWIEGWQGERPFFAYLNYLETHVPYHQLPADRLMTFASDHVTRHDVIRASQAVQRRIFLGDPISEEDTQIFRDLYDAGLRYENDLLADAVEGLRARDILDQTVVVVVSDHGDLHGEHGMFNHTRSLSEYLLSVPLVIRYPPQVPAGLVVETPVTTAALMPTLLDLLGLPPVENIHTRSFAPLFAGDERLSRSPLLAEQYGERNFLLKNYRPYGVFDRLGVRYRSLEEDGWKLIVDSEGGQWLFCPREDPTEARNLIADHPQVAERLAAHLATLVDAYGLGPLDQEPRVLTDAAELDPEMREQLRMLGYSG